MIIGILWGGTTLTSTKRVVFKNVINEHDVIFSIEALVNGVKWEDVVKVMAYREVWKRGDFEFN